MPIWVLGLICLVIAFFADMRHGEYALANLIITNSKGSAHGK